MTEAALIEPQTSAVRPTVPLATVRAILAAVATGISSLRAEPPLPLSEWAEKHFRLAGESSHKKGSWESWPIQIGWMDAFSNDDIEHVDVQKAKRVGYTKTLVAFVAYNIAHRRRKQAVYQPTDNDRDSFVKSEVDPVLDALPAVQAARRKGSQVEDTIAYKAFRDSVLHLLGGKAARAFRRITLAAVMLDEWSAFDQLIEKSSDPGTLAKGRLEGAPHPKFIGGSTPRIKGLCHVERSRLEAHADLRYCIICPHCDVEHPLLPGNLRQDGKKVTHGFQWERGRPETVRHVCPHCHGAITQADYLLRWVGAWVCVKTGLRYGADRVWRDASGAPVRPPKHVAFQLWTAYSPQRAWPDIVDECEKAKRALDAGDSGPMQGFVNETLGETWELVGDKSDEHELQRRAERFDLRTVPVGALILTGGFDLQGNRGELSVWGWGPGLESWTVDHHIIEGNPLSDEFWADVEQYLQRRYVQAWHGGSLGIDAVSMDANYQTQAVLNFVRRLQQKQRVYAVRGDGEPKKPIKGPGTSQDISWQGQKWPNGVKLWTVGVKQAKDLLHGQLAIEQDGPGRVHTSDQLPREWYEQLTAEQRVLVSTPTGTIERWVKRRPRNEVLDCRNYAVHAAYQIGLQNYTDRRWQQVLQAVQPPRDLFSVAAEAHQPVPPPAPQPPAAQADIAPAAPAIPQRPAAARAAPRRW